MRFVFRCLLVCLVLLVSCGDKDYGVTNGTVVKRDHNPAWVQMVTTSNGKTTTMVPLYHDEEWKVLVEWSGSDDKTHKQWFRVSVDVYNECTEGITWAEGKCS